MSQFLGRQDCIESLRKDLVDLQGAIVDVFSRTGPVRFSSWRFPDKLSCNLDICVLLEQYDFVDGEDAFNQHSHIVLLELVIDRLLLLLQSFSCYVEQLTCRHRRDETQQKGCQSVGLVVRNYWSNLVELPSCKKETKSKTRDGDETDTASSDSPHVSSRSDDCRPALAAWSSLSHSQVSSSSNPKKSYHPIDSICSVSCQTVESSLVPCDACHGVQSILRKTGEALVELLQGEGLPCSLQPLLAAVEDTVEVGDMTAGDVAQWTCEQLRDMRRLAKHLQDVRGTVQPLKDKLAASETGWKKLRSQLEKAQDGLRRETEKHQANIVQLEFSLNKAQRCVTEMEQRLRQEQQQHEREMEQRLQQEQQQHEREMEQRLQQEQQQHEREMLSWEESNRRLQEKVALQHDSLQALECENNALQEKVKTLHRLEDEARCNLQERIQQLESQLSATQVLLDKESAKYRSACLQQESMQAKHKALLGRANALDEEREDLQGQLDESEERRANLHDQMQQITEEKEQHKAQVQKEQDFNLELQREKQLHETHIGNLQNTVTELKEWVEALQERERLLVAFPDLSHLAQHQPQTTGNVLLDMEQQLRANRARIQVLEKENVSLQSSLEKLRVRGQQHVTTDNSPQHTLSVSPLTQAYNPVQSSGHSSPVSERSGDRVPRSSLHVNIQSLHFNTGSTVAKNRTKTQSASLVSHFRGSNRQRK